MTAGLTDTWAPRLTTNQDRARFIARDVRDYAEKAPAGLVIDSQTITKELTTAEGTKPHTQTVARVMNFLEKLGKDEVEQTKRRGKKLVDVDLNMRTSVENAFAVGSMIRDQKWEAVISAGDGGAAALQILSDEVGEPVHDFDTSNEE